MLLHAWRVGDLTLFEALTGGAFDRLNWQHSGEFDQNFSKKSNARGFARGGGGGMGGFGIDRYISFRPASEIWKSFLMSGNCSRTHQTHNRDIINILLTSFSHSIL